MSSFPHIKAFYHKNKVNRIFGTVFNDKYFINCNRLLQLGGFIEDARNWEKNRDFGAGSTFYFGNGRTAQIDTNAKIKGVFLYSFTKYVEWPPNEVKDDFRIGVLGRGYVSSELDKMAITKKVLNKPMKVMKFATADDIESCQILYVPAEFSDDIGKIISKIGKKSTLIVTEKPTYVERYSAINFVIVNYRQKFEINRNHFAKYNLKLNEQLTKLASKVIDK